MNQNIRNIVIASLFALAAAAAFIFYGQTVENSAKNKSATTAVLVAATPIVPGTAIEAAVAGKQLTVAAVVNTDLVTGFIPAIDGNGVATTDIAKVGAISSLAGRQFTRDVDANGQVTAGMFQANTTAPVETQVRGRERIVQIPISPDSGLTGTLQNGSRVDVYGIFKLTPKPGAAGTAQEITVVRPIVRNLKVISINPDAAPSSAAAVAGTRVALSVSSDVLAEKLIQLANGQIKPWFVQRPTTGVIDPKGKEVDVETEFSMLNDDIILRDDDPAKNDKAQAVAPALKAAVAKATR